MATFEQGNMWDQWGRTDLFCITTNGTIKSDGSLVMGAGIAKQAREKVPGIDAGLGRWIKGATAGNKYRPYGLALYKTPQQLFAGFQVKFDWKQTAEMSLIRKSTVDLFDWILEFLASNPSVRVDLNFPGIGLGGLSKAAVKPVMERLPAEVHIWQLKTSSQLNFMGLKQ